METKYQMFVIYDTVSNKFKNGSKMDGALWSDEPKKFYTKGMATAIVKQLEKRYKILSKEKMYEPNRLIVVRANIELSTT